MIRVVAAVAVGATMLQVSVLGCGSDDSSGGSGNTGGAQTGGSGGGTNCNPGDTRSCTGPGACQGGQTCEQSGTWGSCDCGSGGTGGSGGAAGSTSGGAGGVSGGGGTGGATGGAAGVGGTGGTGPAPTKLADIKGTPGNLSVQATMIVFSSQNAGAWDILRCSVSGCATPSTLEVGAAEPRAIAGGNEVGYSAVSGVHLCLINGCVFNMNQPTGASSYGLALKNGAVAWGEATTAYVCQGDLTKCASNKVTLAQGMARAVALDNTFAYWAGYDTGVIGQCPIAGCAGNPTIIASGQTQPDALSVDGIHVVWRTNNSIMTKCTSTGCSATPTVLASAQDDATVPSSVVAQGSDVFWTNPTAGTVMKCPVAGCSGKPVVIASGQSSAAGIGATATTVYWLSTSGLMSLPR